MKIQAPPDYSVYNQIVLHNWPIKLNFPPSNDEEKNK